MSLKCYELINSPSGAILDIGCGSGHSIQVLNKISNLFVAALDINKNMLQICAEKKLNAQILNLDIVNEMPFQPASFDGIISVSCMQQLFYASDTQSNNKKIYKFFKSVYFILKREAKACMQFYYEYKWQIDILMKICRKIGFYGGIVVDGEGKNIKCYLVLEVKKKMKIIMKELVLKYLIEKITKKYSKNKNLSSENKNKSFREKSNGKDNK